MGHAQSKKKKHKSNKELSDYINRNVPGYPTDHYITADQFFRNSEPFLYSSSLPSNKTKYMTVPAKNSSKESQLLNLSQISYKDIKVDDHPALTKLQNEQNSRLEKMEERMNQIRIHAMQEADRRKYAYLFKAKTRQSPTKDLLLKAKEKILLKTNICDEKENQKLQNEIKDGDKGEIIPVTVMKDNSFKKSEKEIEKSSTLPAFDNINLNNPRSVLLLPFLLPIFLLLFMLRSISQSERWKKEDKEQKKN